MDADRFDRLTRGLGAPASRRAALGATLAGGFLGALGLTRSVPEAKAQGGTCTLAFSANVRLGPSQGQPLMPNGQIGALRGNLVFGVDETGRLTGELQVPSGERLPVIGQASGYSLQARIELAPQVALEVVGVGEQEISACRGAIDGMVSGPRVGDLGDWHGAVSGAGGRQGGGQDAGDDTARGGRSNRAGGRSDQGSEATTGGGNSGRRGRPPTAQDVAQCTAGETFCEAEGGGGFCASLATNISNCGACGNRCDGNREICQGGVCVDSGDGTASGGGRSGQDCPSGRTSCSDACVDLQTDPVHCGECGRPCASELGAGACIAGECACSPGTTRCNNVCVNTERDPLNCGGCGNECPDDGECLDGACAAAQTACVEGQTRCGDACVDTDTDADNCGTCGLICPVVPETFNCEGGVCVPPSCDPLTNCGGLCVDLQTDSLHCGECGTACPAGETCVGGECAPPTTAGCPPGQILCGAECRDPLPNFGTDGLSCPGGGAPPTACPTGRVLCNGACFPEGACQPTACAPGWGYCYGVCRDFQHDPGYCGNCQTACPGGICLDGTCLICPEDQMPCDGACVDTKTDLANCGFCGIACGTQCIDGRCLGVGTAPTVTCPAGQTRCGNDCVDLTRDSANCGVCGFVCPPETHCTASSTGTGICVIPAEVCFAQGMSTCGEYCADTQIDANNCGACYNVCGAGFECRDGKCYVAAAASNAATLAGEEPIVAAEEPPAFSCPAGQIDCGGVCTDLSFDPFNCGGCGVACGSDNICDFGVCGEVPPPPETVVEEAGAACLATGEVCDPASPGACCSGACNGDGACA